MKLLLLTILVAIISGCDGSNERFMKMRPACLNGVRYYIFSYGVTPALSIDGKLIQCASKQGFQFDQ